MEEFYTSERKHYRYIVVHFFSLIVLLIQISIREAGSRCGHPDIPSHAIVEVIYESENITLAKYKCAEPLILVGKDIRYCNITLNDYWQGEIPSCALNVAYYKPLTYLDQEVLIANDGSIWTCAFGDRVDAYWKIDLLTDFKIKAIQIWTIDDSQPASIIYYFSNGENDQIFPEVGLFEHERKVIPDTNNIRTRHLYMFSNIVKFRYLNISLLNNLESALCEIQVFSIDHQELLSPVSCYQSDLAKQMHIFGGICYYIYFSKSGLTWYEAKMNCIKEHAHLAVITDNNIQTFLRWYILHATWKIGSWSDHKLVWIGSSVKNSYNDIDTKKDENCLTMSSQHYYAKENWSCESKEVKFWICQQNPIKCGLPEQHKHSYIVTLPENYYFKIQETASYKCEEGFQMQDPEYKRTCLVSGRWTGKAPQCKPVFSIIGPNAEKISAIMIPIALIGVIILVGILVLYFWRKHPFSQKYPALHIKWLRRKGSRLSNTYISAPCIDAIPNMRTGEEEVHEFDDSNSVELVSLTNQLAENTNISM